MYLNKLEQELKQNYNKHPKVRLKQGYKKFINENHYKDFITITFRHSQSLNTGQRYFNILLHFINSMYFGRNYKKNNKYLKGFAVYEHHKSGSVHFHILLEDNECLTRDDGKSLLDIFKEKSRKVETSYNNKVFSESSINIKNVYSKNAEGYLMKEGYHVNYDNLSPLSKDGVIFCQ